MDESTASKPPIPIVVAAVVLLLVAVLVLRRRASRDDRALRPVLDAIDSADIPERAKDMLRESVSEVREALASLRKLTDEVVGELT